MRFSTIAVLLVLVVSQSFPAATVSPRLQEALVSATATNSPVRFLALLHDQVDIRNLDQELYSRRAPISERAYTVITTLQEKAAGTQGPLLAYLDQRPASQVKEFRSFWIVNMIQIEALPAVVEELALRDDVDLLELDAELTWDKPVDSNPAPFTIPNGSEIGLRAINAHLMWEMGYTGAGRIVMNIDTGVNGNHPALNYKWRGTHVPASQAWFDPVGGTTFPNETCDLHGTHTMGTMTGLDPATNDTIGVAPGAEWIASNSLCSPGAHTSNSIASFEWAMDPDGNPGTTDDMPDAIGNSWFDPSASDCANGVYRPTFDAVEAAGIAVVFSAGNAGPGGSTITVPKNTNTDLVNVWATGAIDGNSPTHPIATFSSRGPSICGGDGSLLIKPEACAPGVSVRSSAAGGYSFLSGTSMACPHVVGAIALLKEAFPQFTGHELKLALYNTATDLGTTGEENTYGMGLIDVYAAFLSLGAPKPPDDVTAYSDYLSPTSIELNWTDPTNLVNGDTLLAGDYKIYLSRDDVIIDSLDAGVEQLIDTGLNEGQEYEYGLWTKLTSSSLVSNTVVVTWTAGGAVEPSPPTAFGVSGTDEEVLLVWTNPSTNADGTPMVDFGGINLYQDGEIAGTFVRTPADTGMSDSETYVPAVPGLYNWYLTAIDDDVPPNESLPTETLLTPLALPLRDHFGSEGLPNQALWTTVNGDVDTNADGPPSAPYSLNLNGHPIGGDTVDMQPVDLSSMQGTGILLSYYYQPQGTGNAPETGDSLTIYFKNDLGEWIKVMAYPGSSLQPFQHETIDIESAAFNSGGTFLHAQFQVRFTSRGSSGQIPNDDWFVDNVFLGTPAAAIAPSANPVVMDSTLVGSSSTANVDIFNIGTEDLTVTDITSTLPAVFSVDLMSFTVPPAGTQTIEVTFSPDQAGLLAGSLLIASNDAAIDTLSITVSGVGQLPSSAENTDAGLPREFSISRNFPNPFNPTTTIKYELPVASQVDLAVYSLLGSKVRTLVSRQVEAGYHEVVWDGRNDFGIPVTSGVYLYRFTAGEYGMIRKMILLK